MSLSSNTTKLQSILTAINDLPEANSGTDTSDATAVATDILSGKTAYGSEGKITGTMPTATMPTPTISVATNGVITASVNLTTSGYMAATNKSATKTLTTQAAQTITPGTANKTIASQRYLTGTQTIKGDANLIASNIKSGVSIFGVSGTYVGDGSGGGTTSASWEVEEISGVEYGFTLNGDGYYESTNKGVNSSYSLCKVNLNLPFAMDVVVKCINHAESKYDYGILSNIDTTLTLSATADTANVKQSFEDVASEAMPDITNVTYSDVSAGTHYIYIKFIKDSISSNHSDSLQFTIEFQGTGGGSSGGTDDIAASILDRTITSYSNSTLSKIGDYAFYNCTTLNTINCNACTTVGIYAFGYCSKLSQVNLPACTTVYDWAFCYCSKLSQVNLPDCTYLNYRAFWNCRELTNVQLPLVPSLLTQTFQGCIALSTLSLPSCSNIWNTVFSNCYNLVSLYLMSNTMCVLSNSDAFTSTPIGGYSTSAGEYGSIYVPASLLTQYQSATNWTYFSSRFVGI